MQNRRKALKLLFNESTDFYFLYKLHVLLGFAECSALHCLILGPRPQAATNWNITGPGWFLTDSQMITFVHNSLDKTNPTIPFHQKGQKLQFYYVSRCWRAWEHSVNWDQT